MVELSLEGEPRAKDVAPSVERTLGPRFIAGAEERRDLPRRRPGERVQPLAPSGELLPCDLWMSAPFSLCGLVPLDGRDRGIEVSGDRGRHVSLAPSIPRHPDPSIPVLLPYADASASEQRGQIAATALIANEEGGRIPLDIELRSHDRPERPLADGAGLLGMTG